MTHLFYIVLVSFSTIYIYIYFRSLIFTLRKVSSSLSCVFLCFDLFCIVHSMEICIYELKVKLYLYEYLTLFSTVILEYQVAVLMIVSYVQTRALYQVECRSDVSLNSRKALETLYRTAHSRKTPSNNLSRYKYARTRTTSEFYRFNIHTS
jgi:hypothetical protein